MSKSIPVYITLHRTDSGGISAIRASNYPPSKLDQHEAVVHLQLNVDEQIFNPAIRTGIQIEVKDRAEEFDVKKVVTGLQKIKEDLTIPPYPVNDEPF